MATYPSRNGVREHRLVWEEANGRSVPDDHVIHHRNGDITDNRLENLKLMTTTAHQRHHHLGRRRNAVTRARMSAAQNTPEARALKSRTHKGRKQSSQQVVRRQAAMAEFYAAGGRFGRMTPEQRSEQSRRAALARWGRKG